jgi:hypothetical protein
LQAIVVKKDVIERYAIYKDVFRERIRGINPRFNKLTSNISITQAMDVSGLRLCI